MATFPNLPGYVPTQDLDKVDFKKKSALMQETNRQAAIQTPPVYPVPRTALAPDLRNVPTYPCDFTTTTHSTYRPYIQKDIIEQYQPLWVSLDRQVLRFYGFFKESVPESNLENYRVRKLVINFHLEDNSVEINEPKQSNSGVPQGTFLGRQKVHKDGTAMHLNAYDFILGTEIVIHSKAIRLYACDEYTRSWYESVNMPQAPNDLSPNDNFEKYVTPKFQNKEWNGLNSSVLNGRVPSQKQFLNLDRQVLRFYVFSEIPYIMHYYLADDTMEIREINYANSGKDPFPLLLKRQRFPRKFALNQPGHTSFENFIMDHDLKPGMVLEVFGRKFRINGCDPFTQDHYRKIYKVEFPLGDGMDNGEAQQKGFQIPEYNGFGDEEDSLGNVYRLVPHRLGATIFYPINIILK